MGIRRRDLAKHAIKLLVQQYEKDPKPARFMTEDQREGVSEFELAYAVGAISPHEYEMLVSGLTLHRDEYESKVHALIDEMVSRGWIRKGPLMFNPGKAFIHPPQQIILTPEGIDAANKLTWHYRAWRIMRSHFWPIVLGVIGSLIAGIILWFWLKQA